MSAEKRKNIINRPKWQKFYITLEHFWQHCTQKLGLTVSRCVTAVRGKIASWWQIVLIFVFAVVFLYYPIGGWLVHSIDTSNNYHPQSENGSLATIDMMSHLINREVHHKMWTPNLPFIFPSYFLDNMPNFQLGLMSAVSRTAAALERLPITSTLPNAETERHEAVELLQYPGNIWLFSPQNKLMPVPSSNTQYKKGRKKLNNFNDQIAAGRIVLSRDEASLSTFLRFARRDISRQLAQTDAHIRETHDSFVDLKADDIFYFTLGKLYGYAQIFKALSQDYKDVLIRRDIYPQWTRMQNFLECASDLNPAIIRNGKLNSSLAPNHLITINYFGARAVNLLNNIIYRLNQPVDSQQ